MLKFFYKTFLVGLLSASLLLLDFSYKGAMVHMNSAQAETLKTDAVGEGTNIMATLTMTAVGLLASRLYRYKMTTDIMLAAAGGALFIAGDIMAVFKNKEVIKDMETQITRNEEGKIDQKQIETLEKLKKSYMAAKDTATTKKNLQMAAAAAFAAAGVSAYMMAATETTNQATCMLGLQSAISAGKAADTAKCQASYAQCTPPCTGPQAAACLAACSAQLTICNAGVTACGTKVNADMALITQYITARETPSPSASGLTTTTAQSSAIKSALGATAGACTPYGSAQSKAEAGGNCITFTTVNDLDASGGAPIAVAHNEINLQRILNPYPRLIEDPKSYVTSNYVSKVLGFIFPEARADLFSPLGIGSSLAIKFVLSTSQTLATTLDLNLLIPKRRAIAWGILAGLSFAASSATGAEIGKIQENIDKIDKILNSMYAFKNGVATKQTPTVSNPKIDAVSIQNKKLTVNGNQAQDVDLSANGGKGLPCVTGDNPEKCPSFSGTLNTLPAITGMTNDVQAQIGNISNITDSINGKNKISGSTLKDIQMLAGQQNALSNELKRQQKALQAKLTASGSKTDLAKESAILEAQMRAAVQKELDSRKISAKGMLANFGSSGAGTGSKFGSSSSSGSSAGADAENSKKKAAENGINTIAVGANGLGGISDGSAFNAGFDSDAEAARLAAEQKAAEEAAAAAAAANAAAGASMDDYELKNDITKDKESSIFELISNRYQKSYDKLFKRIK